MDPVVTALAVTLVATVVSCLNIRTNAWVTGTFLLVEVIALALLTTLGLVHIERPLTDLLSPQAMDDSGALAPIGIAGLVLVVTQGVFAQFGFGGAVYFAEETKDPRRNIARAVLWSAVITVILEVVPLTFVMLGADSLDGLVGSDLPVQAFLEQRAGHAVAVFVLLSMALAILNANIALSLQAGRLLYVAARDGAMPPALAAPLSRVSGSAHMPRVATIVMGIISGVCCLIPMTVLANASGSLVVTVSPSSRSPRSSCAVARAPTRRDCSGCRCGRYPPSWRCSSSSPSWASACSTRPSGSASGSPRESSWRIRLLRRVSSAS